MSHGLPEWFGHGSIIKDLRYPKPGTRLYVTVRTGDTGLSTVVYARKDGFSCPLVNVKRGGPTEIVTKMLNKLRAKKGIDTKSRRDGWESFGLGVVSATVDGVLISGRSNEIPFFTMLEEFQRIQRDPVIPWSLRHETKGMRTIHQRPALEAEKGGYRLKIEETPSAKLPRFRWEVTKDGVVEEEGTHDHLSYAIRRCESAVRDSVVPSASGPSHLILNVISEECTDPVLDDGKEIACVAIPFSTGASVLRVGENDNIIDLLCRSGVAVVLGEIVEYVYKLCDEIEVVAYYDDKELLDGADWALVAELPKGGTRYKATVLSRVTSECIRPMVRIDGSEYHSGGFVRSELVGIQQRFNA